jgi:hypothetical protein
MEVASDGEVAEPKFRVSHKESCSALLRDGEAFTAIAAGPTVIALGTSASTVIVVTLYVTPAATIHPNAVWLIRDPPRSQKGAALYGS